MAKGHLNDITNLLGLEGLRVIQVVEEEDFVVIEVQAKGEETFCPHCGLKHLYRHGHARPRRVLHAFICGKRVYLEIWGLQRWKCRSCGRTFTQRLEISKPRSRLTNMAEMWVLWLLKFMSFKALSKLLHISYGKIKKVLMDFVRMADLPGSMIDDLEELHLGIDEHSFRHQDMVIVVTDVKAKRVLGILKDDLALPRFAGHEVKAI